jgi:hypothetical protein
MSKHNTALFEVRVNLPDGVTSSQMKQYILESVQSMCGCLSPDDPLFELDRKNVKVVSLGTFETLTSIIPKSHIN